MYIIVHKLIYVFTKTFYLHFR